MTVKAVFRVQCDGPCKGWLSLREGYVPGTDILPGDQIVTPTAELACNWPDTRSAMSAALAHGFRRVPARLGLVCPACRKCADCGHPHRTSGCSEFSCLCGVRP